MTDPDRTYVVAKLDGSDWTVHRWGEQRIVFEGAFMDAWSRAATLASAAAPARVIAVNAEGSVVARAIFEQREPGDAPEATDRWADARPMS